MHVIVICICLCVDCLLCLMRDATKYCSISKYNFRFRGRSKNCFRVAIRRLQKSWQYAYRDRRVKRREWSKFWIQRIQAGVRQYSWRYSQFMGSYKHSGIKLDRKVGFLDLYESSL